MNIPGAIDAELSIASLRDEIIGADALFKTPYGERIMVYCDYTASGRCLLFVENFIQTVQRHYANTHTEDDITGRSMTSLLHQAETAIKNGVNAGPDGRIVAVGNGASGAIDKLQQILGVAWPPATRVFVEAALDHFMSGDQRAALRDYLNQHQPVVFVGPYEHHSNEVSWRQGLATVVEVNIDKDGGIELAHLEELLRAPEYQGRLRIGSFSAASNVTGMVTPVAEIACLLHEHDALACFDYAASAPYVNIDMNPPPREDGRDASIDAVFISPHKFIGGPGSSGVLVFNRRLYDETLPPTVAAGGTVDYVSPAGQDYIRDVEEREKAGTPGVLQTIKAAMAFLVKAQFGTDAIEEREAQLLGRAMAEWQAHPGIEILGNPDPARRIGIVSFNVRSRNNRHLHPKFLTALLNDLFGIQSRAGCSCAGPYGHRLLGIGLDESQRFREWILKGFSGIKPGWCRIGFHFSMDDVEADYVIAAVKFVADHGDKFIGEYDFELSSGAWNHRRETLLADDLSLKAALASSGCKRTALSASYRRELYASYLSKAEDLATELGERPTSDQRLPGELGELQFFDYVKQS